MLQIKFETFKAGSSDHLQSVAVKILFIFKIILSKTVLKNKHFNLKNLNLRLNLSTTVIVGGMTGTDLFWVPVFKSIHFSLKKKTPDTEQRTAKSTEKNLWLLPFPSWFGKKVKFQKKVLKIRIFALYLTDLLSDSSGLKAEKTMTQIITPNFLREV